MKVKFPVHFVDGHWELLYGGSIPVAEGTYADLTLEADALSDPEFREAVTRRNSVLILKAGTELLIALKPAKELSPSITKHLREAPPKIDFFRDGRIGRDHRFVSVRLSVPTKQQNRRNINSGGLWLRIDGLADRGVESSTIDLPDIPGLKENRATSLNHACTMLSEVIETERLAHTASVYLSVFYLEEDGCWYPLDDLRNKALATAERQVIKRLWDEALRLMGSNPFGERK